MSTNLTVNLSQTLQNTLNHEGVYAYAVVFDTNGMVGSPTTIVDGSTSTPTVSPTVSIALPPGLNGGKIYFIIQSVTAGDASGLFGTGGVITQESDINWNNAASSDFRYDSFEVSLLGAAGDAGNLTDVNVFGIPMSVSIDYPNGATAETRGYAVNGTSIFSDIAAINSGALVHTYSEGPLSGDNPLAAAPATALAAGGPGGASATDWNAYVESLGANGASGVQIAGYFNGAPSVEWMVYNGTNTQYLEYHNPGFYSYTLSWVPDTGPGVVTGTYVLTPTSNVLTPTSNSQIQGTIKISSADLANSIYSTLGNATIENPDGSSYQFSSLSNTGTVVVGPEMNTGTNNEWGAFFVKLLTGFIGGYLGGTTTAQNSQLGTDPINLSQNWNFDPTFAFGGQIAAGNPGAVTPWSWNTTTYGTGVSFDQYAHVFFSNTNSYSNGYSDALMSLFQQGGPLISTGYSAALASNPFSTTSGSGVVTVTDPNAGTYAAGDLVTFGGVPGFAGINMDQTFAIIPVSATTYQVTLPGGATANATTTGGGSAVVSQMDVAQITLNLFDDNEPAASGQTLPQTQGYTPTLIYDTSNGPFAAFQDSPTASNLSFVISLGLGQMTVAPGSTVQIGFYTGQSGGLAQFDYVSLPSSSSESLFQTWIYGSGAFTAGGGASPTGSIIQLNGLPYNTGINWYQIQITNGEASRTYNLYANALAGSGLLNPYYDQGGVDQAGSLAIDGLAQIPAATLPATVQYTTSLNIAAFNGGTLSMDPALLALITDPSVISNASNSGTWPTTASIVAPVLGTVSDTTFTNWTGSTPAYSYSVPNSELTDVTNGSLSFGWMGADQQWIGFNANHMNGTTLDPIQVVGGYTNKVSGLDVALLTFSSTGPYTSHAPVSVQADIDGKWFTAATPLSNGQYSVSMTEYLASDTGFTTPVANPSSALQFTVNVAELAFANTGGGNYLQLDPGVGGTGSWIHLETTGSSMPNSTLLAYATDALGNMIGRDGSITTNLSDAVLAEIGSVAFDNGMVMQQGTQSVYLPVDLQLHFAVQTLNNVIEQVPGVQVTGTGSLSVSVNGGFGTLNLSATVDNTLSGDASLAGSQRDYNQPWAYLTQGQGVHVEVAGSAWNINTIHFVQIDVNPSTGDWSVGGVAYGNTDTFRSAVQANWDPGFAATGGRGNFSVAGDWSVSKGSGFYALVLATEGGDIFVIGTANVDGQNHIRTYGQNNFGFEDLRADLGSDFDYNDLVMKLTVL